ncbi:MAG: dihydrolipoyl dehydrogenase, partial [Halobaculum sp.]
MDTVDLLVIGSGSGLEVANAAVQRGHSVGVVEKGRIGGTCLNRGCIPSKRLLYHAEVAETVERADAFHIDATVEDVAFGDIVREVTEDVHASADSIREGLESSPDHTLYAGEGRFVDTRTVELVDGPVEGTRVRGETVVIAAGTRPSIPPIDGIEDIPYLTSTEALTLETPPEELVIVGGGYIAAELGHFFGTFGTDVRIVGRRPHLLPETDPEVAEAFTDRYAERFTTHTGYTATSVSSADGRITVEAAPYEYGDEPGITDGDRLTVSGDELLLAAGRVPNTDILAVENTGVETDEQGFVETDEYLRTTAEDVWALGDIVGEYLLKHSANHEAGAVARNLFGDGLEPVDYSAMPYAVFASPEVAGVGATEDDLRADGRAYATRTYRYEDTARGNAMKTSGFVKPLIDLDGRILGCHVIGPDASNLIQEVVVAMTAGSGTVRDIRESIHIHPALSEVIQRAFSGRFTRRDHGGRHDHSHDHSHEHHGHSHESHAHE